MQGIFSKITTKQYQTYYQRMASPQQDLSFCKETRLFDVKHIRFNSIVDMKNIAYNDRTIVHWVSYKPGAAGFSSIYLRLMDVIFTITKLEALDEFQVHLVSSKSINLQKKTMLKWHQYNK